MLQVARHRLIVCELVVVILTIIPRGGLFAANFTREIIIFQDNTPPLVQQTIVNNLEVKLGASIIHGLSFINGLAMQFPLNNLTLIHQTLQNNNVNFYADLVGLMD